MEWISVNDRLPKNLERVLTCDEYGNMHVFLHREVYKYPFGISENNTKYYMPTHWMHLPKPPK